MLALFPHTITPEHSVVVGVGSSLRTIGTTEITLRIPCPPHAIAQATVRCRVLPTLAARLILGMDFVLAHGILYNAIKEAVTLQSCGLRAPVTSTRPLSSAPAVIAQFASPPSTHVLAPDMRAPPDMDAYTLPFTIVPDQPHSDAEPTFDDDLPSPLRQAFGQLFAAYPEVWRPELGLLSTGEAMRLPSRVLDADPHKFKPRLYRVSQRDRLAIDSVFDELARQGRLHKAPPGDEGNNYDNSMRIKGTDVMLNGGMRIAMMELS